MPFTRRTFFKGLATTASLAATPMMSGCAAAGDPFLHGVASGDPLADRVILWTRITPADLQGDALASPQTDSAIAYEWIMASDPELLNVVASGTGTTGPDRDFTVKEDPAGLAPGTTYYYRFSALGWHSPVGRTRTLPAGSTEHLRIAFTSCSNWAYGYFNVYASIAARADLDAVLHLGDYIYEYGNGHYDSDKVDRNHSPSHDIVSLQDYRMRHAQYKTDPDAQEMHRQHPVIAIWDDHEFADDAFSDGSVDHRDALHGAWQERRRVAMQAYFEWMPVRIQGFNEQGEPRIYRDFRFGNLIDLIMLDTRINGRSEQTTLGNLNTLNDPDHRLLDPAQENWLIDKLSTSHQDGTRWRVLGQQVMMAQLAAGAIGFNMDQWDGYPQNRNRLFDHLQHNGIDNFVVLTGDIHSSWAMDLSPEPFKASIYDRHTGEGSIGVEFVTPAVSSPGIEDQILAGVASKSLEASLPHMKFVDFFHRGYVLLDINHQRIQAEWHWVRIVSRPRVRANFARAYQVAAGRPGLTRVRAETASRSDAPALAPKLANHLRVI